KVFRPVRSRLITKKEKSLFGKTYYCRELQDQKITSPFTGVVTRIYPNHSLHITSKGGAQIILALQLPKSNYQLEEKLFQREVVAGQKVNLDTVLFSLHQPEKIASLSIYILWQPEILKKIEVNKNRNLTSWLKLHYLQPSFSSPMPGQWQNPGGKVEKGENHAEALKREVKEETGLEVKQVGDLVFRFIDKESKFDIYFYEVKVVVYLTLEELEKKEVVLGLVEAIGN
ncbi:18862_t:CDS:2, partial [Racocetra fulgida]